MSNHASLSAATQDRKARLAQLKSLKRKTLDTVDEDRAVINGLKSVDGPGVLQSPERRATDSYLSGRNYDTATRGAKLGFETMPSQGQDTVEARAAEIAAEASLQQQREESGQDKPLDLFKLQPKKPNWDLKRDLERKLDILNVRTDNAIARIVRQRIEKARLEEQANGAGNDALGIEGIALVESTREMEREQLQDAEAEENNT